MQINLSRGNDGMKARSRFEVRIAATLGRVQDVYPSPSILRFVQVSDFRFESRFDFAMKSIYAGTNRKRRTISDS